jgi:hypothetical protein
MKQSLLKHLMSSFAAVTLLLGNVVLADEKPSETAPPVEATSQVLSEAPTDTVSQTTPTEKTAKLARKRGRKKAQATTPEKLESTEGETTPVPTTN